MAAVPVTPQAGLVSEVAVGGTAVIPVPGGITGGFLQNPATSADQAISSPEILYVDPVGVPGAAPGSANGTTFALYPGDTWPIIAGQTTPTRVNAASNGHKFSAVFWP